MRAAFIALLSIATQVQAADEPARDPTALPGGGGGGRAWPGAPPDAAASAPHATADNAIRQIVFAGGKAYVVQRGRRYGVGEQIDGARIERITEQAVWLREAGQVRREPLYAGVEKRPPPEAAASASGVKKSKEKP